VRDFTSAATPVDNNAVRAETPKTALPPTKALGFALVMIDDVLFFMSVLLCGLSHLRCFDGLSNPRSFLNSIMINQKDSDTALVIVISYTPQYLTYWRVFQVPVYHILLLIVNKPNMNHNLLTVKYY
jgi:hypothetical protein